MTEYLACACERGVNVEFLAVGHKGAERIAFGRIQGVNLFGKFFKYAFERGSLSAEEHFINIERSCRYVGNYRFFGYTRFNDRAGEKFLCKTGYGIDLFIIVLVCKGLECDFCYLRGRIDKRVDINAFCKRARRRQFRAVE